MPGSKLFLIDGHALCYRSFYGIRELSTSRGQPTNAVFGFVNTLKKILREFKPDYMAVCFDSKEKTLRQKKYAEYKIQRPPMPDALISQMGIIKDVIKAYNIAAIELGGFEADDIIATLSKNFSRNNLEVVIVSDDKDMFQLADQRVKFFSARNDSMMEIRDIKKRFGFDPDHIVDYIALAGDKVDNIPGVKGIGEVTAKTLINEYGTIENIFQQIDKVKPEKLQEKLQTQKNEAVLSKELAILETKVPIKLSLEQMKVQSPDEVRLFEIFKDLEFKKLASELKTEEPRGETAAFKMLEKKAEMEDFSKEVLKKGYFAFMCDGQNNLSSQEDLWNEKQAHRFDGMAMSLGEDISYYIKGSKFNQIQPLFSNEKIVKVTFNLKDGLKLIPEAQKIISSELFDIMLAAYLLNPALSKVEISDLCWTYLKMSISEQSKLQDEIISLGKLYPLILREIEEKSLTKLLNDLEMPLAVVLSKMESYGVNLDVPFLKKMSKSCEAKINTLTATLYKKAGCEFNLNSPKQLSHVLFEKLKLPVIKKTKTGYSTDEGVLSILAAQDEFPSMILEYRQLSKLKSTYIDALPKLVNKHSGRVHAQFIQTGTETGRLSSRNPNLQNIPIRTDLGRQIRKAIIPSKKDHILVAADYSQIELRILAHLSGDKNLSKAFENDEDIHNFTASLIFDTPQEKIDYHMRDTAKRVNFGIIYGMSSFGLAKDLKITQFEADEFIQKYFTRYPDVKKFMDGCIKECEKKGFVLTLLNRRRYIPEIHSRNNTVKQFAQRQAINTPVQGSAADLIKLAMINIQKEIEKKKLKSQMIITVHDELVFDVPESEKDKVTILIRDLMEHPIELKVPIKVSMKIGQNWMETEEKS